MWTFNFNVMTIGLYDWLTDLYPVYYVHDLYDAFTQGHPAIIDTPFPNENERLFHEKEI